MEDADEEFYPVTLTDKRTGFQAGTLMIKINYKPIQKNLLVATWADKLLSESALLDKYEFFNDQLANEFKDDCQFGYLSFALNTLTIPAMAEGAPG